MSSPNSPVHDTRRAVSNPYDLNQVEPCECITPSAERENFIKADKAATIPRAQHETGGTVQPRGILKQSSTTTGVSYNSGNSGRKSATISPTKSLCNHGDEGSRSASAGPLSCGNHGSEGDGILSLGKPRTCDNVRLETAFVGRYDNSGCEIEKSNGRKSVTIANTPEEKQYEPSSPDDTESVCSTITVHRDTIRILAPQPQKFLPDSPRGSHNSDSPEWPSPPEPLTPQTPQTPTYNLEFDSDSIKRMLENLPVSPETDSMGGSVHEQDQGFHEEAERSNESQGHRQGDRDDRSDSDSKCKKVKCDSECTERMEQPPDELRLLDCEIARRRCLRDSYGRDSNPDSGIGGMQCDTAVSCSSSDSNNLPNTGELFEF